MTALKKSLALHSAVCALLCGLTCAPQTRAEEPDHFEEGTTALSAGRYQDAIDHLKAYADLAPSHPDASFNRGLAYVTRVRAGAEQPGDLGRAAASFEEVLLMRPGDDDAAQALELVRGEVARRRSQRGKEVVRVSPTIDRIVVGWASERTWGIAAIVASCLLSLGLVLRRRSPGPLHVTGTLLVPLGLVAVLMLIPLYYGARQLRETTKQGVVVVRETSLSDEDGEPQAGEPIPEAARVEVSSHGGPRTKVRYGAREGWLPANTVRVLRR